jgi:hypothetical protein
LSPREAGQQLPQSFRTAVTIVATGLAEVDRKATKCDIVAART